MCCYFPTYKFGEGVCKMKLADFFTLEGKRALRQMIFLGKFVHIDEQSIDQVAWKENYNYDQKRHFLFIQNTTIYPASLQKILPISTVFPCDCSKQRNEEKYIKFKNQARSDGIAPLQEQFVLYQLKVVKERIEVKILSILPIGYNEDTYVFPVGKRRNTAYKDPLLIESLDCFEFLSYPEIFGLPTVFYLGNQIYAVEQNFVVPLPIEEHIEQVVFKNDRVAVIQFQKGFLLYEPIDEIDTDPIRDEENTTAIIVYQEDHQKFEGHFFRHLQENLKSAGIWLDDRDLVYLHASIKTQPFTLVRGAHSRSACEIYAKTLGATVGENLFYLYPKIGWSNMYDLLLEQIPAHEFVFYQYPNLMTFLARANEKPDELFFCFVADLDFARPEHYLHQFLSILQEKRGERLFKYRNTYHQSSVYLETLSIGDNVIFIGLPNESEMSYPLTESCLGKMSMVTLGKPKCFVRILEEIEGTYDWEFSYLDISATAYRTQWTRLIDPFMFFSKEELQFFDAMNELLKEGLSSYKLQTLTLKHMANLISNGYISMNGQGILNRKEWIDRCVGEFVIQKMNGALPSLQKALGNKKHSKPYKGELLQLFESDYAKKISRFNYTIETIKAKVRRYEDEGFFY